MQKKRSTPTIGLVCVFLITVGADGRSTPDAQKAKECQDLKERIASTRSLIASQEQQRKQAEIRVRECEDGLKKKKFVSCEGVRVVPKGIQEVIDKNRENLKKEEALQKKLCN